MRTYFQMDERDEFESAKNLLVRRCADWAQSRDLPANPLVLDAALVARHLSADGRLALWTPAHLRRVLLEWIPARLVADPEQVRDAPETLRTLLAFLAAKGLRDPRGASDHENEAALAAATEEYLSVLTDPAHFGIGKFWALAARDNGVDLADRRAVERFRAEIEAGRAVYDMELLTRLLQEQADQPPPGADRMLPKFPVILPPREELLEAAGGSRVVRRLTAFTEWAGAEGRVLTATGQIRRADARWLSETLGTGEQNHQVRSSAELPQLSLIFNWARKTRLVRVIKGRRLRSVGRSAPLLRDPEELWQRAFEALPEMREVICPPLFMTGETSLLHDSFPETLSDMLSTIYNVPHPVPVARLRESVWLSCRVRFPLSHVREFQRRMWKTHAGIDFDNMLGALAELGAVELTDDVAHEIFTVDLDDDVELPYGAERPFSPEVRAFLRETLSGPAPLVRLTPLGTRAVRARLLAEGKDAGLVGEMATADAAEMLGVVSQHYSPETARLEIEGWLKAHDDDAESLVDAARACQFRGRTAALVNTLKEILPEGRKLLHRLRSDPALAPTAVSALVDEGILDALDLTEREQALVMTEGFLGLMELGGPMAARQALVVVPPSEVQSVLAALLASGHPDRKGLEEFRVMVAESHRARNPLTRFGRPPAPGTADRPVGRGRKRRH